MTQENADIQPQAEPHIVKSHDIHIDADYADWIADIKSRYRSAQVKAAVKVNAEKLLFNWQLGRDLVQKKAEERWGAGVVEQVSLDLKREFPDAEGFSTSNLGYMKKWYLFYADGDAEEKLQRAVGELQSSVNQAVIKLQQSVGEIQHLVSKTNNEIGMAFPQPFALVPWGHHVDIITKCKSIDEALFYVGKTIEQGLSRNSLANCIKANLYEHQGKIVNNFTNHLPALQSKLVQEVLKENYDFGFATVEHEIYDDAEDKRAGNRGKGYAAEVDGESADTCNENCGYNKEVAVFLKVNLLNHFKTGYCNEAVKGDADAAHYARGDRIDEGYQRRNEGNENGSDCRRKDCSDGGIACYSYTSDRFAVGGIGATAEECADH